MKLNIPGYTINNNPIHSGRDTIVVNAIRNSDKTEVVIKFLKDEHPSPELVARFKHEYDVGKLCTHSNDIVQMYAFERYDLSYAIVMEKINLPTLAEVLESNKKFTLLDFLEIAISISKALSHIHNNGIIHKDINPFNIMCDFDNKKVRIIDFGLSATLPRELTEILNLDIGGSLEYISPEQTGRMNRGIDYRTDYYSLGITFYQMITGTLPFNTQDPMKLIHCHIAIEPTEPYKINKNIPMTISKIIMKLMVKKAEGRYQNINGLLEDLKKCREQLIANGRIDNFNIGSKDLFNRFKIPEKLYGRENEINTLLHTYEKTSQGNVELILVSGYSGIGKSSLIHELNKPIVQKHGYFISGKFDQYKLNVPYAALIQSLDEFFQKILTEPEERVEMLRSKILKAVGDNGQIIIDMIPTLSSIIGPQPKSAKLGSAEAKNRFDYILQKFIQSLSGLDHPLVIFWDDLQWADLHSLRMLEKIITSSDSKSLLIIGAYRINEVDAVHPLTHTLENISKNKGTFETILLGPLNLENVTELIMDTLHQTRENIGELAHICFEKTGGNPFFLTQLLLNLYQEKIIEFSTEKNQWIWELDKIKRKNITDNVAELMVSQLSKLPIETQQALQYASCIGNKFNLSLLSMLFKKEQSSLLDILQKALHENYIICYGEYYLAKEYYFSHDRIQQAAYSMINQQDRIIININLARLILENINQGEDESIFEAANHYNIGTKFGIPEFIDIEEQNKIAQVNMTASKLAKKSGSFEESMIYIEEALKYKVNLSWDKDYNILFDLYAEAAETCFLCEKYDLTEEYVNTCINNSSFDSDKLRAVIIQTRSLSAQRKFSQLIDLLTETLLSLGIWVPKNPNTIHILYMIIKTKILLRHKSNTEILNLPETSDEKYISIIQLLTLSVYAVYFASPKMVPIIVCMTIQLSLKYGNTKGSDFAYACYGSYVCGALEDNEGRLKFGTLSLELMEKFNNTEMSARIYYMNYANINQWREPMRNIAHTFSENFERGLRNGESQYAWSSIVSYSFTSFIAGVELKYLSNKILQYKTHLIKENNIANKTYLIYLWVQFKILQKLTGEGNSEHKDDFSDDEIISFAIENKLHVAHFNLYFFKIITKYLFDDIDDETLEIIDKCEEYSFSVVYTFVYPEYMLYKSLSMILLYQSEKSWYKKIKILINLNKWQKKRKKWIGFFKPNYIHQYLLVEAETMWRIYGNYSEASRLYDQAIAAAHENEFINHEAIANELAAKFYLSYNKPDIASVYMQEAYYCYKIWGANAKVSHIEEKYPELLVIIKDMNSLTDNSQHISISQHMSSRSGMQELDINSILKFTEAISQTIILEDLLSILMTIMIENAGAQRSCLLLIKDGTFYIEAERNIHSNDVLALNSISINSKNMPISIINYVARTNKYIVLNDATNSSQFETDPYIKMNKAKSVLCIPLLNLEIVTGILYMENNSVDGAFTEDRVNILNLLSSQIATSIENARLYNDTCKLQDNLSSINKAYEKLVPRDFLSLLDKKSITDVNIGDQVQKNMSVLFVNILNFSHISKNMTAQDNFNFINSFLGMIAPIIRKYNGFVDKYIGNIIMALFPRDADDAIQCTLEMQRVLKIYNHKRITKGRELISLGVGINTGSLMLGTVGEKNRLSVTVISDMVNVASRVSYLTKQYHMGILITEDTYISLKNPARYKIQMVEEQVLVKGKTKKIMIYSVDY